MNYDVSDLCEILVKILGEYNIISVPNWFLHFKKYEKTSHKFIKFVDFQWQINVFDHLFAPNRRAAAIFLKPTTLGSIFALILALLYSKKLGRLMAPGLKIAKKYC